MPGQPKRRMVLDTLWAMTRAEYGAEDTESTPLDLACDYIASGKGGLTQLAQLVDMRMPKGHRASREVVRQAIYSFDDAKQRLTDARVEWTHAVHEMTSEELEDSFGMIQTDLDLKKVVAKDSLRRFQSSAYNRAEFGSKPGVEITLNVGSLHLEALRMRVVEEAESAQSNGTLRTREAPTLAAGVPNDAMNDVVDAEYELLQ